MTKTKKHLQQLNKAACLVLATLLVAPALRAQKTEERFKNDSIAAKFKNQNAVYTNYITKLVIAQDKYDGSLVATTYVTMDKLFISDRSPNNQNKDYFFSSDFHPITDYSAVAYIPNEKGGYKRVESYGLKIEGQADNVFYDDIEHATVYYTGITKNTVTETKFTQQHIDIAQLPSFVFQAGIPIVSQVFEVEVPDYVKINFVIKNQGETDIKQNLAQKDGKTIYRFTASNLKANKDYDNARSLWYYRPHIVPYVSTYRLPGAVKDSVILRDSNATYRNEYKYVKDLNIKLDTPLVRIVADLTKNDKTQREKATHIYNWVRNNIHYIAFEKGMQGFVPRPADTVYKRKYGDCKDMASITMAMCRQAGLKAYFAIIGTWDLPYTNDEVRGPRLTNHMICAVNLNEDWVFLDATNNMQGFGDNRMDIQGKEAMVCIDAHNYKIVRIPVVPADKNVVTDSTFVRITQDHIIGSTRQHITGFPAESVVRVTKYLKQQDRDDEMRGRLMRGSDKFRLVKYNIDANDADTKSAQIFADFTIENYAHKTGKDYYVNMNLNRESGIERIDDSERHAAYFHPYKNKVKEVVVMDIPEGYKVTRLPKPAHNSIDGVWSYNIAYYADKKKVTLVKEYELQSLSLNYNQFSDNNKIVDALNQEYKESVILTTSKNSNKMKRNNQKRN